MPNPNQPRPIGDILTYLEIIDTKIMRANDKHFHENRYWTYNSVKAFGLLLPYWSCDKIRGILKKLTEIGVILTGNFNKTKYDQTKWFSLSDEYLYLIETRAKPNTRKNWCRSQTYTR